MFYQTLADTVVNDLLQWMKKLKKTCEGRWDKTAWRKSLTLTVWPTF